MTLEQFRAELALGGITDTEMQNKFIEFCMNWAATHPVGIQTVLSMAMGYLKHGLMLDSIVRYQGAVIVPISDKGLVNPSPDLEGFKRIAECLTRLT